jgi:hypothetical protein
MRREVIDDDVWAAVAQCGKFGDTFSGALRRALNIPFPNNGPKPPQKIGPKGRGNFRVATRRLERRLEGRDLAFRFDEEPWKTWKLPTSKSDKEEIRRMRDEALDFATKNGATQGQRHAVMKAFSEAGYYVTGPRS